MDNKNVKQPLSKFTLSNEIKTSFEIGDIIPIFWRDTVPGDIFRNTTNVNIRFMPLISPLMHKIDLQIHYFYTPYRLLDKNFRDILAKPESPLTCPTLDDLSIPSDRKILNENNLLRAFGIHSDDGTLPLEAQKMTSQYFLRAYQLIVNYYYKHELLDDTYIDDMRPDDLENLGLDMLKVARAKHGLDYFMSNLPDTQYGSMVELDMDGNGTIRVDEMRVAEKLQYFKEKLYTRARGRYKQFLQTFFGVSPTNMELQIPHYLGGGSQTLEITDIDQTGNYSIEDNISPLGSQAGKVNNIKRGYNFKYRCEEHGLILGLAFALPRASYISGVPREFMKNDFFSFYNPTFANLGLQETYGMELSASRKDTFGYNERYAELKSAKDIIAGDFASEAVNHWHLGIDLRQEYLSKDFVHVRENNNPFAVQDISGASEMCFDLSKYSLYWGFSSSASFPRVYAIIAPTDATSSLLDNILDSNRERSGKTYDGITGIDISKNKVPLTQVNITENKYITSGAETGNEIFLPYFDTGRNIKEFMIPLDLGNKPNDMFTTLTNKQVYSPSENFTKFLKTTDNNYCLPASEVRNNHLLMVAFNHCEALRPIPKMATPSISL